MASTGRRSEDGGESSYDRDSSSHQHYQHQRRRQPQMQPQMPQQQYHGQSHPHSSYPHEQLQHGKMQNQYPPGNTANTNGKYNISSTVPVPPRMRLRKWSDMTRTIWHYERIEQIGEGTYGQVYRARCKDTNEIVAMKKIRVHHGAHWGMPPTVIREIKILKRLVHPNLVRMIEVVSSKGMEHLDADDYHKGSDRSRKKNKHKTGGGQGAAAENNGKDNKNSTKNDTSNNSNSKQIDISDAREGYKGNLFLVLEYVPHDLTGLLDVAYKFSEVEIKCVFRQLLEALRYMHDQKYVHRDIKSSNILIDRNFRLKLADFGLARSIEPPLLDNLHDRGSSQEFTNKVITLWYRPPELLLGATRYGFAVDIWSAGCILAELVLGRPLFTGKTEMDQLQLIFDMVGTPTSKSWPGVRDLKLLRTGDVTIDGDNNRKRPKLRERYETKMNNIAPGAIKLVEKLLELDPSKRPTASRALSHRYFSQGPQAPDLPEELGEMKLAEGGSFHEFQTKKKRKEAKAQAEKIKQAALDGGHTTKQAQEEFDACYRGIMEKVAQEGLAPSAVANSSNQTNDIGTGRDRSQKAVEGNSREAQNEKSADAKERDNGDKEERHRGKHRSSRSDRSPEHRTSGSRATREKEYRESSSRGRERRPRDRSDTGNSSSRHENARERSRDKNEKEKNRDGSSSFPGTSKEAESSHRDRDHGKERSRSSRRASESEDRRKKRRREDDTERSSHSKRERDKERQREHRKASKVESGSNSNESKSKSENNSEEIISSSVHNKEENKSREGVATDENLHKESMGKGDSSKPKNAADGERNDKTEKTAVEKPQSLQDEDKNTHSKDAHIIVGKPDETEEPKPDMEKQSGNEHHSRSTSSRGDKKRSDRSRDRSRDDDARKDRRDRDRDQHHRRRSSKEKDGRSREGDRDRASSGRSSSNTKKRKSRNRSRSPDRDGSPGRSRDDRHHRHRRDRDHSRHERDRERRHHQDDLRDLERRPRNDRYHHHDDWGPRGHPPAMQRRGGDFGGNPDFGGPQHNRRDFPPRGGDPGMYGGGDWGPRGDGRGGGPGDFRGPPSRHPGPPHGGRPMDYYPPGGDHPPPGYRDRERGPRRDRDRR